MRGGKVLDRIVEQVAKDDEQLTKVNLEGRCICDEGAIRLANALASNCVVTSMNLSKNDIGPNGASALATALEQNMTLTTINLNRNDLGNKGAMALTRALQTNLTVSNLQLKENGIGNEGAQAIYDSISVSRSILSLDLSENDIDTSLLSTIDQVVHSSKSYFEGGGEQILYFSSPKKCAENDIPISQTFSSTLSPMSRGASLSTDSSSLASYDGIIFGMSTFDYSNSNNRWGGLGRESNENELQSTTTGTIGGGGTPLMLNWMEMVGAFVAPSMNEKDDPQANRNISSLDPSKDENENCESSKNIGFISHAQDDVNERRIAIDLSKYENESDASSGFIGFVSNSQDDVSESTSGNDLFDLPKFEITSSGAYTSSRNNVEDSAPKFFSSICNRLLSKPLPYFIFSTLIAAVISGVVVGIKSRTHFDSASVVVGSGITGLKHVPTSLSPSFLPSSTPSFAPSTDFSKQSLSQVGQSISGEAPSDQSGFSVSLSYDGTILSIGSPYHDEKGLSNTGSVRIYEALNMPSGKHGTRWTQIGQIKGEDAFGFLGHSVCLSGDGTRLAASEPGHASKKGRVRVFARVQSEWIPLGQDLTGSKAGELFGYQVAMSGDGNHIAVGSPRHDDGDNAKDSKQGRAQIFHLLSKELWMRVGSPLHGSSGSEEFGFSVALSHDGSIVAAGAPGSSEGGYVRIYEQDDTTTNRSWTSFGIISNINPGAQATDRFGSSISLSSDGFQIAIGSPLFDKGYGLASVFSLDTSSSNWLRRGGFIFGEAEAKLGSSIAMSSKGDYMIVGSPGDTTNGIDSGRVQVFHWNGYMWEESIPLKAISIKDAFGFSVAISNRAEMLSVGAPVRGGAFDQAQGYTRTFTLRNS